MSSRTQQAVMSRSLLRDDRGASAVEYSLIAAAVAAVLVLVLLMLGRTTGGLFGSMDCWASTGDGCTSNAAGSTDAPVGQPTIDPEAAEAQQAALQETTKKAEGSCTSHASSKNNGKAYGGCK